MRLDHDFTPRSPHPGLPPLVAETQRSAMSSPGRRLHGLEGVIGGTRIRMPSLISWIKAGNKCGIKARGILAGHGITLTPVYPHTRVEYAQVLRALGDCVVATRNDHFPLALGQAYAFDELPVLRSHLLSSATLREFINDFNAAGNLIHPWARLTLEECADQAWICTDVPVPDSHRHPFRYIIEATLVMVAKLLRNFLGRDFTLSEVALRHANPPYADHYPTYFGLMPTFGQQRNGLALPRAWLDRLVREGQADLHEKTRAQVMQRLALQQRDLAHEIETLLKQQPQLLAAHMEEIARRFHMTPAVLQRHLKQEGARFSDIQGHVRHELAKALLLEAGASVADVSRRLGYANRRAFTSAFKLRSNLTPTQYREQHGAPGPD